MEDIPQYNLIQAIDPTKVKVPISDRFAKLTLSSNKKQQAKNDDVPVAQKEKRESISRNLLKTLSLEDENSMDKKSQEDKSSSNDSKSRQNPLLRSESSKDTDHNNSLTLEDECETMDPLNVTDDDDSHTQLQLTDDLEILSQRIATMAVVSRPISISSDSTEHLNDITQLVSTESQQSTGNEHKLHIVRNIPIKIAEALKQDNILLNCSDSNEKNPFEVTDDETDEEKTEDGQDDEDDEEEGAITISDSSGSHHDGEPDEMITSSLPSTTQTSDSLQLPSMKDDKAERVAAFLRDVSIERRVMQASGDFALNDTIDQILDNEALDKIQETLAKSRQIASADTESMSADVDEEVTPKSLTEREKRLRAVGNLTKANEKPNDQNNSYTNSNNAGEIALENVNRLANDETKDNTIISDDEDLEEINKTPKNQSKRFEMNDETKLNSEFSSLNLNKTPPTRYNNEKDPHRLANEETEVNSEFPQTETNNNLEIEANLKTSNRHESPQRMQNIDNNHLRLTNQETEMNTELPRTESNKIATICQEDQHRLANDETVANSIMSSPDEYSEINKLSDASIVYDYTRDLKTPDRNVHRFANDETKDNSPQSIANTPEALSNSINSQQSHTSIINSSSENNLAQTEESITILETDDEENEQQNIPSPQSISETDEEENVEPKKLSSSRSSHTDENKKLSNSFHNEDSSSSSDDDGQMSRIQMSMASINISAKINIKIHIPQTNSTDTSQDEQSHGDEQEQEERNSAEDERLTEEQNSVEDDKENRTTESNEQTNQQSNEDLIKPCNQLQSKPAVATCLSPLEKSLANSIEEVEDKEFLTEAEKLLTQLYGKSWQTPDVIRTLKHSRQSGDSKSNTSETSASKKKDSKSNNRGEIKTRHKYAVEESILDDFSMFRRNIVRTNLDSTRLVTPKTTIQQRLIKNNEISTEPRNFKKPPLNKEQAEAPKPQTERKKAREPVAKVITNKRRVKNDKWRQLLDNDTDSEGNNASDDDDADQSWSKNASQIELDNSDSDFEIVTKPKTRNMKTNNNTIKTRQGRRNVTDNLSKQLNKSKEGDIVYLDLSKEEVEVQEGLPPESPPANHDETFASRLQDILKTCRHEDKAKLPSSATKTKRKLFTPIFGDDLEGGLPKEDSKQKEAAAKLINLDDDGLLEDHDNCPFDRQGRPKVLDLVNKQLEAVKIGKPIFQLTPSPKKQTQPLTAKNVKTVESSTSKNKKEEDKTIFKTPLTTKSKGPPPKSFQELCKTPEYKYSFLKSLDVTVSKSFCHPDALFYRDNYRTKKEDLSKILYEIYNEKLFYNKIDVPITWNKKLSNTAGRCLNKKKLGNRTSVIELSDKVLTSADRLRCTLIHELCHAATWICNGEGGHGSTWKEWARKANATFPEIPKIGVCHQYDIEYKYTYKCTLCAAKSHAHSKSKKVENIRCSYCHGAIEIFLNKKDKEGNIMPTPVKEATGFAKFVKDNYKKFKRDDLKHADVMKLLSGEFATLKLTTN